MRALGDAELVAVYFSSKVTKYVGWELTAFVKP